MRRSEKLLLAILVLGLLTWQGGRLFDRVMFDPIRRSRAQLDRLDEQIAEQIGQLAELSLAEATLKLWQQRSLPPDPLTAQRLYQQWLTDLAQDCGFAALKVYPDRVMSKNDACVGVLVSINAEARLDQLCLFLRRFSRTDLAQHVTVLNIDSTQDRGDPILRVTIMAEGLALNDAPPRQRLFPTGTNPMIDPSANTSAAEYANLIANNPFAKPMPKIVERPPAREEPAEPEIDPAEFTYLVAAFAQDDQRQAWLYDRLNNTNVVISPGKPFFAAGIEAVVRAIGEDFVLLDYNDTRWRLKLGKNLRSMERVPATESDVNQPAARE
ncbi:MAG: hypothetical protein O3C40_19600 [Planctomycetota bacterium]|nr:hypothetical protein [Planctomycetota bacterium]